MNQVHEVSMIGGHKIFSTNQHTQTNTEKKKILHKSGSTHKCHSLKKGINLQ